MERRWRRNQRCTKEADDKGRGRIGRKTKAVHGFIRGRHVDTRKSGKLATRRVFGRPHTALTKRNVAYVTQVADVTK